MFSIFTTRCRIESYKRKRNSKRNCFEFYETYDRNINFKFDTKCQFANGKKTKQKLIMKLNLVGSLLFIHKIKINLNLDINFFENEQCYCSNITSTTTYFNRFTVCVLLSGFKFFYQFLIK